MDPRAATRPNREESGHKRGVVDVRVERPLKLEIKVQTARVALWDELVVVADVVAHVTEAPSCLAPCACQMSGCAPGRACEGLQAAVPVLGPKVIVRGYEELALSLALRTGILERKDGQRFHARPQKVERGLLLPKNLPDRGRAFLLVQYRDTPLRYVRHMHSIAP